MSSLYQKRGYYYYQRYWDNPKTGENERVSFSLRTKDEKEAERKREKWDKHYDRKEREPDIKDTTWEEAKNKYISHRSKKVKSGELSNYTLTSDKGALKRFEEWMEDEGIEEYILTVENNAENLKDFKYERLEEVSKTTIANNLRHLQSFFSWLQDQRIIDTVPFQTVDIPQPDQKLNVPTKAEWKEIKKEVRTRLESTGEPFYVALWIQARTGMRIGEVVRLTWEKAYTGRDKYAYLNPMEKTASIHFKQRHRVVPVGHLWEEIQSLERSDNTPYLFESPNRGKDKHIRRDTWSKRTTQLFEDIGYGEYTNHSIRHALITELIRQGETMKKIADLVGHSSRQIVEIYSHLEPADLADMFE